MTPWIPNALPCLRIALSIALALMTRQPVTFTVIYVLGGISDALDVDDAKEVRIWS